MTYHELLAKIKHYEIQPWSDMPNDKDELASALRAVVELHKPYVPAFIDANVAKDGGGTCLHCSLIAGDSLSVLHPCPTIQAIEKELI